MYHGKKFLAVIPARSGSKGLPGKNIKKICGKPLIVWSIEQALDSKLLDTVFVSTDSDRIARISESARVKVPFLRPPELAQDDSPTYEAVLHVIAELEKQNRQYDYITLLEPTSPLRKKGDIDAAAKLICNNPGADSLISVGKVHMEHPMVVKRITETGLISSYLSLDDNVYQRQQTDEAYFPYGVVYCCKIEVYKQQKTFYTEKTMPYFIERWQNYEIDDQLDFDLIEHIMQMKKEVVCG